MTDYYNATGVPVAHTLGDAVAIAAEFALIQAGLSAKLPTLTGNGSKIVAVNSGGTGLEAITPTVAHGGTGLTTITDHAVMLGSGTSAVTPLLLGANELLVGQSGADPVGQSGATLRTTIGLGTGDSPTFAGLTLSSPLAVAQGGTGAASLTDGGVLLGSGTGAVTAMAVLGAGEMIVGDGAGDPVAQSGATLRTSIGVGTGNSPQFTGLTLTSNLVVPSSFNITSGGETLASFVKDDSVYLRCDNVVKFNTDGNGITVRSATAIATPAVDAPGAGMVTFQDADQTTLIGYIGFGGATTTFEITNSIRGGSIEIYAMDAAGNPEQAFTYTTDGQTTLYYGGASKFFTTAGGVSVDGELVGDGVNVDLVRGSAFRMNTGGFTTGAQTATFTATNKPGSGTTAPTQWLTFSLNGTDYYIPCWL